ncbi:hypothetical protein J2Y69_003087 [Microbacterium resistens]|uniref:Uncharacterized protein n=1 Tax=Microbacterium resistens TaxID=156977 RepID=A0ABU1SFV0_9MICO|nr:hypothetical protein [Microbacterium resistens]MDR6868471.1 hypothetical protein [Microbacterium resistens]
MQTYVVEARRHEDGPWSRVMTVQEDLVDEIAPLVPSEPGEWRMRLEDPDVNHPHPSQAVTAKITRWDRLRWWALMRFSRRARR